MSSRRKYPLIKLTSAANQKENTSEHSELEHTPRLEEYQQQLDRDNNDTCNEMELALEKFYANPYDYLDYIIGLYFKKLENKNAALGLEEDIMRLYNQNWNYIKANVHAYSKQVEDKLHRDSPAKHIKMKRMKQLSFSDDDGGGGNDNNDSNGDNGDGDDDGGGDSSKLNEYKNDFYLRNPDPKHMVYSEGESCLNKELMIKQAIECLKESQICVPTKKYLRVDDLNEDYKHKIEMLDSKHINNLKCEANAFRNNLPKDDNDSYNQYSNINNRIHKDKYYYLNNPNEVINNRRMTNGINDITELKHANKEKLENDFHEEAIKVAVTKMSIHHTALPIQNYDEEEYKHEQLGLHYTDYDNDMKVDYDILRDKLKLFLKQDNIHNLDAVTRGKSANKVVRKKKVLARKERESAKSSKKRKAPTVHKEWVDNWNSKIKDETLRHERMVERVKKRNEEKRKKKQSQEESKHITTTDQPYTHAEKDDHVVVDINAIDEHDEFAQFQSSPSYYITNNTNGQMKHNGSVIVNKFKHQHI